MLEAVVARVTGLRTHSISPGKLKGIEFLELDWNAPQDEWEAVVTYEKGVPVEMSWYTWSVSPECFQKHLTELFQGRYKLEGEQGGNGHYYSKITAA
jgi:hypothetical protein